MGQNYESLWNDWQRTLRTRFNKEKEALTQSELSDSQAITQSGDWNLGPRFNPRGDTLSYTRINPHEYPTLRLTDAAGEEDRDGVRRNFGYTSTWSPDGQVLVFSQFDFYRNYSVYNDLYLYDRSRSSLRRLTEGARLRDPDFHPAGHDLIAVENRRGQNRLVLNSLETGAQETLDWIEADITLAHPRWSPDGKRLAVSASKSGQQGLYVIDMAQKKVTPILMDKALDLNPTWSPDGKYIVFSSDATGIFNLYAYDLEGGGLFQVSRVLGGVLTPELNPEMTEVYFSSYSSKGFDIHRMPWDPSTWLPVEGLPMQAVPEETFAASALNDALEAYSPWPSLRPRYGSPILGSDEDGVQIGAATGGQDILGKHKFDALALYGPEAGRAAYSMQYINDLFYPSLQFGFTDLAIAHADLIPNDDYWERIRRFDFSASFPTLSFSRFHAITLGYRFERISSLTDIPSGLLRPDEGDLAGFRLMLSFDSTKSYGFSSSREDGRRLFLRYERLGDRLGSDFNQDRYTAAWQEYLGLPWRHHLMASRIRGGYSRGDPLVQRAFELGRARLSEELINPEQTELALRGYPSRLLRGRKFTLATLEYRFPIHNIERGIRTWPFFFRRLHGALFYDIGNAWDDHTSLSEFRSSTGLELKMDRVLGHWVPVRF